MFLVIYSLKFYLETKIMSKWYIYKQNGKKNSQTSFLRKLLNLVFKEQSIKQNIEYPTFFQYTKLFQNYRYQSSENSVYFLNMHAMFNVEVFCILNSVINTEFLNGNFLFLNHILVSWIKAALKKARHDDFYLRVTRCQSLTMLTLNKSRKIKFIRPQKNI